MKHNVALLLMVAGCGVSSLAAAEMAFVAKGRIEAACADNGKWKRGDGYVMSTGRHYLYANRGLGPGNFLVRARLSLERLDGTADPGEIRSDTWRVDGTFESGYGYGLSHNPSGASILLFHGSGWNWSSVSFKDSAMKHH